MADPADEALNEMERNEAIRARQGKPQTVPPAFDDEGNKICIDCGNEIPPARAALTFVVRCIGCQRAHEKREKL